MERLRTQRGGTSWFAAAAVPYCTGPVTYQNRAPLDTDVKTWRRPSPLKNRSRRS